MHEIYEKISANEGKQINLDNKNINLEDNSKDEVTVVTKSSNDDLTQIIYFDFDKFELSDVSKNKIKLFIKKNGTKINEYVVFGHTDTKGTKAYNLSLSIKRAKVVQNLLIEYGVKKNNINIVGKGEDSLAIDTLDDTKQPANRRVEIKKSN